MPLRNLLGSCVKLGGGWSKINLQLNIIHIPPPKKKSTRRVFRVCLDFQRILVLPHNSFSHNTGQFGGAGSVIKAFLLLTVQFQEGQAISMTETFKASKIRGSADERVIAGHERVSLTKIPGPWT